MKIYRVGGAVRDALLGLSIKDCDYVVVGSTPEKMLAEGFTPVGKDFPVFLHPKTHSEYALARTERKSAPGYHGFVFHCSADVTLEQDLLRRDLTVNAMAIDTDNEQNIIDPYGGQRDLANRIFRHVSPAFAEDPVRILRVARFSARFTTFTIAPETMQLMHKMVQAGEVDALVPERVWQELARGLMEEQPSRMMQVLFDTGALSRLIPELAQVWGIPVIGQTTHGKRIMDHLDLCAARDASLAVRWAVMIGEFATIINNMTATVSAATVSAANVISHGICARLKVPSEIRDITLMAVREREQLDATLNLSALQIVKLFERCDAFRKPARFIEMLAATFIDSSTEKMTTTTSMTMSTEQHFLQRALHAAQTVASGEIAKEVAKQFPRQPNKIAEAISSARIASVDRLLNESASPDL